MKKKSRYYILTVLFAAAMLTQSALSAEKTKQITLKGEILDLSCYTGHGEKGASHKQCAVSCAKKGIPIGLLDKETKKVYLIVPSHADESMKIYKQLTAKVGTEVSVKGTVKQTSGLPVLYLGDGAH